MRTAGRTMALWRILADAIMYLHLSLMILFVFSACILVFSCFRQISFGWLIFYYVVIISAIVMVIAPKLGLTKDCPLTDLEYMLRRLYDPSESWVRTQSLGATVIFNTTGIEVPEVIFTIMGGMGVAAMIASVVVQIVRKKSNI